MHDLLSLLPKDVQLIVYRLLFDRLYKRVLMNYRSIWLNDYEVLGNMRGACATCVAFHWDKYGQNFCDFYLGRTMWAYFRFRPIANDRDNPNHTTRTIPHRDYVYNMFTGAIVCYLHPNYW